MNKYLQVSKYPVPIVLDELRKAINYKIYIDLDVTNVFHQIPISDADGKILSVKTSIGQFQPRFMSEGVSPASLVLMRLMRDIFSDYLEWMIVIYDNILVLAENYQDEYEKLVKDV